MQHLPHDSSTAVALHGEQAEWGLVEQLLAGIADLLASGNWQRGGDAKATRPKPIPRPGVDDGTTRHGRTTRPGREVAEYLARFHPDNAEEVHE